MKIKFLVLTVLGMGLVSSCSKEDSLEQQSSLISPLYNQEEELPTDPPPTEEDDEEDDNGNPFVIG